MSLKKKLTKGNYFAINWEEAAIENGSDQPGNYKKKFFESGYSVTQLTL